MQVLRSLVVFLVCWNCPDLTAPRNAPRTYIICKGNPGGEPALMPTHKNANGDDCNDDLRSPLPSCDHPE